MNRLLAAMSLSTALITPAFAQDATVVDCKAFLTMSHDEQKASMEAAMMSDTMDAQAAMAKDGTMKTAGAMATDDAIAAAVKMCTAHPDMAITAAMHEMH